MTGTYTTLWLALTLVTPFKMLQCAKMMVIPRSEHAENQLSKLKRRHSSRIFNILLRDHCFIRLLFSEVLICWSMEFSCYFFDCSSYCFLCPSWAFCFSFLWTHPGSLCIHSDFNYNLDYKRFQIFIRAAWRAFYSFSLPSLVSSSTNMISIIANIYHVSSTKLKLGTLQGKYSYCLLKKELESDRNGIWTREILLYTLSHPTMIPLHINHLLYLLYLIARLCQQLATTLSRISWRQHHFSLGKFTVISVDQI